MQRSSGAWHLHFVTAGGHEGFSGTPLWKIKEQPGPWSRAARGLGLEALTVVTRLFSFKYCSGLNDYQNYGPLFRIQL